MNRRLAPWRPAFLLGLALVARVIQAADASSTAPAAVPSGPNEPRVLVVIGAPGEDEYAADFRRQAQLWEEACTRAGARATTLGFDPRPPAGPDAGATPVTTPATPATPATIAGTTNDLARLEATLAAEPRTGAGALWLVFIGHGTFDGADAKFNLRGPDLSVTNLAAWLRPFERPVVVINTASASAPFLKPLAGTNRVVITATRSGNEQIVTHFGRYLAESVADPAADLDHDGQTSLLEAFLSAAHRVTEFYQTAGRLATEHPLLDDNGDGLGTPADWFRGPRATKQAAGGASIDGLRAHQVHLIRSAAELALPPAVRARRDELELTVARLRAARPEPPDDAYYARIEALLLDLARLYATNSPAPAALPGR